MVETTSETSGSGKPHVEPVETNYKSKSARKQTTEGQTKTRFKQKKRAKLSQLPRNRSATFRLAPRMKKNRTLKRSWFGVKGESRTMTNGPYRIPNSFYGKVFIYDF